MRLFELSKDEGEGEKGDGFRVRREIGKRRGQEVKGEE